MQLTLFGTPYIYQGQEIGHINLPIQGKDAFPEEEYKDIQTINWLKEIRKRNLGKEEEEEEVNYIKARARDNARSPVQVSWRPS